MRWGNAALAAGSLCGCLLLLEIGLRVAGYNPFGDLVSGERVLFIQPSAHPDRAYEGIPHAKGRAWGTEIQLNSYGLRDREYPLQKPPGTRRILALGDSVTFGNFLPENATYPRRLEGLLTESGLAVEVINLGLGGYDMLQSVAALEAVGLDFQPDLVVLGFCVNDIGIASGNLEYVERLQRYGGSAWYRLRLAQWLRMQLDRIALIQDLQQANRPDRFRADYANRVEAIDSDAGLAALMRPLQGLPGNDRRFAFAGMYAGPVNVGRVRYAFTRLRELSQDGGFPVVVVMIPFLFDDDDNREAWQAVYRIVEHESRRAGFDWVNPYAAFAGQGFAELLQRPHDPIHPNALGHRLLAEQLHAHIRARLSAP